MNPIIVGIVVAAIIVFLLRKRAEDSMSKPTIPPGSSRSVPDPAAPRSDQQPIVAPIIKPPGTTTSGEVTPTPTPIPTLVTNPADSFHRTTLETVKTDPQLALRDIQIHRQCVSYGNITMCVPGWENRTGITSSEQDALAAAFRTMISMPLPWFSGDFSQAHADIIASAFPQYEVRWEKPS